MLEIKKGRPTTLCQPISYRDVHDFDAYFDSIDLSERSSSEHHEVDMIPSPPYRQSQIATSRMPSVNNNTQRERTVSNINLHVRWEGQQSGEKFVEPHNQASSFQNNHHLENNDKDEQDGDTNRHYDYQWQHQLNVSKPLHGRTRVGKTTSFESVSSLMSSCRRESDDIASISSIRPWFIVDPFVSFPNRNNDIPDRWRLSSDDLSLDISDEEIGHPAPKTTAKAKAGVTGRPAVSPSSGLTEFTGTPKAKSRHHGATPSTKLGDPSLKLVPSPERFEKNTLATAVVKSPEAELPSPPKTTELPRGPIEESRLPFHDEARRNPSVPLTERRMAPPSKWQQAVHPFRRNRTIAEPHRLPLQSEYSYRGQLLRAKGKWKRKWAREHFIIQHNVLLTCTKEEPFLVKICIPLKNIQSVEPFKTRERKPGEAGRFFQVIYIQAAKKGKERFATLQCQASTAAEAEEWIAILKRFRDRAQSPATGLVDYVVRENAEMAIRQLHDAMKNSGLYQIVARLCSAVATEEAYRLRTAFWKLRENQIEETLKKEQRKYEQGLARAEEEVRVAKSAGAIQEAAAKRLARLGVLLGKLSILVNSRRHLALMELKRKTDIRYTEETASAMHEVMVNALLVEHNMSAYRQVQWRKKRIAFALETPFKRLMKEAMLTIEAQGHIIKTTKGMRQRALFGLFRTKALEERNTLSIAISRWRKLASLEERRIEALRTLLSSQRREDFHVVLRRWNASCILRNQKDMRACKVLEEMIFKHEQRQLSLTLRTWTTFASQREQLEALQIAANFNLVNDQIVSSFDRLPMERACYMFVLGLRKMILKRVAFGMHLIRNAAATNSIRDREYAVGCSLLAKAQKSRLQIAFFQWVKFAFKCHYFSSKHLVGAMQLFLTIRFLIKSTSSETFRIWRRNAKTDNDVRRLARRKITETTGDTKSASAAQMESILTHLKLNRLITSLSILKANTREVNLLRGVSRAQALERIVHIADRQRISAVASAFCRLVCNTHPTIIGRGKLLFGRAEEEHSPLMGEAVDQRELSNSLETRPTRTLESFITSYGNQNHVHITPAAFRGSPLPTAYRSFSYDANMRYPLSVPTPGLTSESRVAGLMGRLLWLGVGMTRGPDGRPQVLLQGHRAVRQSELERNGSMQMLQSSPSPNGQWKRPGHNNTIRSLGIKKELKPAGSYITIKPRYQISPQGLPLRSKRTRISPRLQRHRSIETFSSFDLTSNDMWMLEKGVATGNQHSSSFKFKHTSIPDSTGSHPFSFDLPSFSSSLRRYEKHFGPDKYKGLTETESLETYERSFFDSDPSLVDSFATALPEVHFPPIGTKTSYPDARPTNRKIPLSVSLHANSSPYGKSMRCTTPILETPKRDITNLLPATTYRPLGKVPQSPLMFVHKNDTTAVHLKHHPMTTDAKSDQIEEWLRSSKQVKNTQCPQKVDRRQNHQQSLRRPSFPVSNTTLHQFSEAGLSAYLNYLLASCGTPYLRTTTGETPDIDFDRIHDFVFDDIEGIRDLSSLDIAQFLQNETSQTMEDITTTEKVDLCNTNIRRTSMQTDNIHGELRPEKYSTLESRTGCMATEDSMTNEEEMQSAGNSSLAQKAYRARIVLTPTRTGLAENLLADEISSEYSVHSSNEPLISTELVIVRGETGGACGAGDFAVIASDVPKRMSNRKKPKRFDFRKSKDKTLDIGSTKVRDAVPSGTLTPTQHSHLDPPFTRISEKHVGSYPIHRPLRQSQLPCQISEVSKGVPVTSALVNNISHPQRRFIAKAPFNDTRRINIHDYPGVRICKPGGALLPPLF